MRPAQIEGNVLRLIDDLTGGRPIEDSIFECKANWGDPVKQARQLAAHANAARGEIITWVIGVDQNNKKVVGATDVELANWYPQVESRFDSNLAPHLLPDLRIPYGEHTVVALCFETNRAPYVVKGDGKCRHDFEVPVRVGRKTQSSKREDLLRMLLPTIAQPDVEVISADFSQSKQRSDQSHQGWDFEVRLYFNPSSTDRLTIPFHRLSANIAGTSLAFDKLTSFSLHPVSAHGNVAAQQEQLSVSGPALLFFRASTRTAVSGTMPCNFALEITLPVAEAGGIVTNVVIPFGDRWEERHGEWTLPMREPQQVS